MTEIFKEPPVEATAEEVRHGWASLCARVERLEAEKEALEHDLKSLRQTAEKVIAHRQKSHAELVILLTSLVSKLPINDVGLIVSKLVEHNDEVSHFLAGLVKGGTDHGIERPAVLKSRDQTRRELVSAVTAAVNDLLSMDSPLEQDLLREVARDPETFFSPRTVRATRCYLKGQVPRERVLREYGKEALAFFADLTTDPKLNPRPKQDEIVLGFRPDFEACFEQISECPPEKRQALRTLYQRVQQSKSGSPEARTQRNTFLKLSFLIELLHYYDNQNTEPADVVFAQRLPALVEQLVVASPEDPLDEALLVDAETLIGHVINPDHRHMIVNNIGKGGGAGRTLKFVLRFRGDPRPDVGELGPEFIKHLLPSGSQKAPAPEALSAPLRLIPAEMQSQVLKMLISTDRLRKDEALKLTDTVASQLGIEKVLEQAKAGPAVPPEVERQMAWDRIKDLVLRRADPKTLANAFRERLHAHYDAEEMRLSWIVLTEADAISLIRVICQLPYLPNGKTDPIARPVLETYVTRLLHEKYAATYTKVVTSLKNMYRAKPDSPTLRNFTALVRWVDSEAADRLCQSIGMPVAAT